MDLLIFVISVWMSKTEKPMNIVIGSERTLIKVREMLQDGYVVFVQHRHSTQSRLF